MEIVDPRIHPDALPAGCVPRIYRDPDQTYRPLPTIRTPLGTVITRWSLTDAERAAIVRGEDVYVTLLTYHQPLQPLLATVGPPPRDFLERW